MNNTKKVVLIVTGVIVVCLISAGIVLGIYCAGGNKISDFFGVFRGSRVLVDETQALELDGISGISVDCPSGDVIVLPGSETRVEMKGTLWTPEERSNTSLSRRTAASLP